SSPPPWPDRITPSVKRLKVQVFLCITVLRVLPQQWKTNTFLPWLVLTAKLQHRRWRPSYLIMPVHHQHSPWGPQLPTLELMPITERGTGLLQRLTRQTARCRIPRPTFQSSQISKPTTWTTTGPKRQFIKFSPISLLKFTPT